MFKKIYVETLHRYEEDFRQFLFIASAKDRRVGDDDKKRYFALPHSIADSFEVLLTLGGQVKPKEGLACPFTCEGLEYYRQHFRLSDDQWENVQGFVRELGTVVGGDLLAYMKERLKTECSGCSRSPAASTVADGLLFAAVVGFASFQKAGMGEGNLHRCQNMRPIHPQTRDRLFFSWKRTPTRIVH